MVRPDYAGAGIANLMASLVQGFGEAGSPYPPCTALPGADLRGWRSVALIVIDGLGDNWLQARGRGSLLADARGGALTSVCPSTTAAAIPTFLTGYPPQQHGLTGWFTWFSELQEVLAVLPFVPRDPARPRLEGVSPASLVGLPPVYDRLQAACSTVMPATIAGSVFNRAFSGSARVGSFVDIEGFCDRLVEAVSGPGRRFVYAYWPEFDAVAHRFGAASQEARVQFRLVDRAMRALYRRLRGQDLLLVITADHGFVDCPPSGTLQVEAHPLLAEALARPLCGEPRLAFCYVKPERRARFEAYVEERLSGFMTAVPGEALVRDGWFGSGEAHPRLAERVGDYALVMNESRCIRDRLPGERPFDQIGVHGGVTADEMYVPLVLLPCR